MHIPRDFPKWDKQVDGLEDAWRWVWESERSRLPANLLAPRTGQIWETIHDCEANYRAHIDFPRPRFNLVFGVAKSPNQFEPADFEAYLMQFGTAVLRRGERVRILEGAEPKPISIRFVPVRYHELRESIIPTEIRNLSAYHGGYELSLKVAKTICDFQVSAHQAYFNEAFHLVEDVA